MQRSYISYILIFIVIFVATPALADSRNFHAQELARLESGELVTRPETRMRKGLRLFGGSSWQVIQAPSDVVWQAIQDIEHYHHMIPKLVRARVLNVKDARRRVELHHRGGPFDVTYGLYMTTDARRREVYFELDPERDGSIEATWGFIIVRKFPDSLVGKARSSSRRAKKVPTQRTLLTFGILSDIGSDGIRSIVRPLLQERLLRVPMKIKRFLEGRGKMYYRAYYRAARPKKRRAL